MANYAASHNLVDFSGFSLFCSEKDKEFYDQFAVYASGCYPAYMVKVLAQTPPTSEVAIPFKCLCIIAAGTTRQVVNDWLDTNREAPWSYALSNYIRTYFFLNNRLNFKQINLLGNLLLTVEGETELAAKFRSKMGARSIFECNIAASAFSPIQKQIMTETVSRTTLANARCAGTLIENLLVRKSRNMPIPDLSFFKDTTESFTNEQRAALRIQQ